MTIFNFEKYPNKYFVETGTYRGQSLLKACETNCFEKLFSIEIDLNLYNQVSLLFKDRKNVKLFHGDSEKLLPDVVAQLDGQATFWLDGHYTGGHAGKGKTNSPILAELEAIKNHPIRTHTILIDDVNSFGLEDFDYVTKEEIVKKLLEINNNYQISIQDRGTTPNQVLVAHCHL